MLKRKQVLIDEYQEEWINDYKAIRNMSFSECIRMAIDQIILEKKFNPTEALLDQRSTQAKMKVKGWR